MNTPQPRLDYSITLGRIDRFLSTDEFASVNLRSSLVKNHTDSTEAIEIAVYSVPGLERPKFSEIVNKKFRTCHVGDTFGPSWVQLVINHSLPIGSE